MNCSYNEATGKQEVVLSFKRKELLYDVENAAYIEGHVLETENSHIRHTVQDVGQEGNVDRVTRMFSLAVVQCKEFLYPFAKKEIYETELDDRLRQPEVYGIVIEVPTDFSQTTLFLLEKLIHEYIVCRTLADWMSITNPPKAETWLAKAVEAESGIRMTLYNRRGHIRRSLHPF